MELTHTFTVPVTPDKAFTVLQDIERIGPCMPGATIDSVDGKAFTGTVKVKIGPIKVTYKGEAEYSELDEENLTAVIDARGKESRGSGTANAKVTAKLTQVEGGTEVHVVTDLAITGKPAQFGRGVMEEVGQKLINRFAECLAEKLGEDESGAGDEAPAQGAPAADIPTPDDQGTADATAAGSATPSSDGDTGKDNTAEPACMATGNAASAPASGARIHRAPVEEAEAIDLLDVAGAPVAKRLAPVLGGALVLAFLWWLIRRGD